MNEEIKIIDLLNKIANNEEVPKKIRYDGNDYYFCNHCEIYEVIESSELCGKDLYNLLDNLNDKVEIIEEDNKTEYENVEEINYVGCKVEINIIGIKELFNTDSPVVTEHCIDKINQLIRNQKKLIDELKENKK